MKQIHFLLLLFFLFIGMVSCTKNFTALNTNPNGVPFDTTTTGGDDVVNTALFIQYLSGQMEYVYACNGASRTQT